MQSKIIEVIESESETRIDTYLSVRLRSKSRSYIKKLIKNGNIKVDGNIVKPNYKVKKGQILDIKIPDPVAIEVNAENISVDIVYQDKDIAVVNKQQGLVVHPAPGNYSGTLVNALLYHIDNLSGINGKIRPGIVHRLDKDTSGLLVVAKNDIAHRSLAKQIKDKTAKRIYWALVDGNLKHDNGSISVPIARHPNDRKKMWISTKPNAREAVTHYKVIKRYDLYTLVELALETGRTHQIRVHMKYIGHPVVGDKTYGKKKQMFNLEGQLLHAKKLGFFHPITNEYLEFETDLPKYYSSILKMIS